MVKMKNIRKTDNIISADCYEEGIEEKHFCLEISSTTFEIITNSRGEKDAYVWQAVNKIRKFANEGKELPKEAMAMWC